MTTTPEATEPVDPPSWRTGLPIVDARAMAILASLVDASDRSLATVTRAIVAAVDEAMTTLPYHPATSRAAGS